MNEELIKQIAERTEKECSHINLNFAWEWEKKFAELIVRECAEIAKKEQAFNAQYTDAKMHPQVNIDQCILMGFGI